MDYILKRSARRRSASLSVTSTGQILVRAPHYMPRFLLDRFVTKHKEWIMTRQKALAKRPRNPHPYFTKTRLESFINEKIKKYSNLLGLYPARVRLTDALTYWGSCSPSDMLSFSTRLCLVPARAVEYVVVHEICHLRHRGHGARFWQLVNKTYPAANEMRQVLRQIPRD